MQTVTTLFDEAARRDMQTPWTEVEIFGNDLAFGKPVTVSSQVAGFEGVKAVNATIEDDDGWGSQNTTPPGETEWIVVDLLWQTEINSVKFFARTHAGTGYGMPMEMMVQTSPDNTNWTAQAILAGIPANPQPSYIAGFDDLVACRYVRLLAHREAFRQDFDGTYRFMLGEVQAYRTPLKIYDATKGSINHVISIGEINWDLDTVGLNEWRTGNVRLEIDNSENQWSPDNTKGLFQYQQARGAQVRIRAGYLLEDGSKELLTVFTGYLKEPARHSDTISGVLTCYDFWERLERVNIDGLKDPTTSAWYSGKQVDFLIKKVFAFAGFTRFEYVFEVATMVIPTADFSGMNAREGIVKLAEVMNFECGIDTKGIGFFRSRDVSGKSITLEVRNKKNGDKNLINVSNISMGWDDVVNCWTAKNASDVEISKEPTIGRPNSYDRYGCNRQEVSNNYLRQLSDSQILGVLTQYFDWYSESKLGCDCDIIFLPQVELGDVHKVTQQEPSPQAATQLTWNAGKGWNAGYTWGAADSFLIWKKSMKVVGIKINIEEFNISLKYREV